MPVSTASLSVDGYGLWDLQACFGITEEDGSYKALRAAFEDLPADEYAPGSGRYRRYARGIFLPWARDFTWMPATESQAREGMNGYYQGDNNPEYVGMTRELPAISESVCRNQLLLEMIQFDFSQTRWSEDDSVWPLYVGVH